MTTSLNFLNYWGERFIAFAGPMLLQSSLLILVLLGIELAFRQRIRATIRHVLWLVLLLKLVLPPSFAFPTGMAYWFPAPSASPSNPTAATMVTINYGPSSPQPAEREGGPRQPPPLLSWPAALLLLELGIGAALLAFVLRRSQAISRKLAQAEPAGVDLAPTLEECLRQMGMRRKVGLRFADRFDSPALCGLWQPVILLPRNLVRELDQRQLRDVILHELAHLRRRDLWINHLQALLQAIYWWHPLLWLANARIRRVREEATDETVLAVLQDEAQSYPATLLAVAKSALQRPMLGLGLIGIMESRSALGRRIRRMVELGPPRSAKVGVAGHALAIILAALLLPMARGEQTNLRTPGAHDNPASPAPISRTRAQSDKSEENLVSRVYKVDPLVFRAHLRKALPHANKLSTAKLAQRFFHRLGVSTNAPSVIQFFEHEGVLYARTTKRGQKLIETAMAGLSKQPVELQIEARFVKAPAKILRRAGLDVAPHPNAHAILTAAQTRAVLDAIKKDGVINTVFAPRLTTLDGREAQISVVTETVNSRLNPAALKPPGLRSTNGVVQGLLGGPPTRCGYTLDALANVAPDGYTIRLQSKLSGKDLLTYGKSGRNRKIWVNNLEQYAIVPVPRFRVRKAHTTANLFAGQTLVMGGFSDRVETATSKGLADQGPYSGSSPARLLALVTVHLIDPAGNRLPVELHPPRPADEIPAQP